MAGRPSYEDAIERRRRERELGGERLVDLRLDFELDGQGLLSVGGVWDRRLADFDGEADTGAVVRVHPGQRRAVEWFATWLDAHAERRDNPPAIDADAYEIDSDPTRVYSALFAGGRRAGKTYVAVGLIAGAYAVRFPGAIAWMVSPSEPKHDELRRYVHGLLPREWIDRETNDGWELCNGSRILLKSAHNAEGLKEGKANIVLLNEGQMMSERAYTIARGAIVDSSGIVIVCANPPVEAKDQQWVAEFAAEAASGKREAVYMEFNPLQNPHIDRRALLAMSAELDERTYAIEVLGQFRGPKDAVAWNWVRKENELAPPADYTDVTAMIMAEMGEGPGIEAVPGLDVQRFPYIGGPIYRLFVPPGVRATPDTVLAWIVDEVVLDGGDEVAYCEELEAKGYTPATTMIVCDASGRYQHSRRRSTDSAPPEWKGRGSFDIIRGAGYYRIKPPDRKQNRNPQIVDRMRAFTSLICTTGGERRLFADPDRAPRTCEAIRDWRTVHGAPSRTSDFAHLGDGASYPIVRLFPRRLRSGVKSTNPRTVQDPVASRVDKVVAMPASASDLRILPRSSGRGARTRGL